MRCSAGSWCSTGTSRRAGGTRRPPARCERWRGCASASSRSGRLGGAALDVLPQEPPPKVPVAPNLILTPHAAYYSPAAEERAYRLCLARVREVLGFV